MTRVLVVDDKEESVYYLSSLLESNGCEVESARDGAEALAKARSSPPELIVSDLLMPVMDGYTLLRHWKADARLKDVPFIVYTATYTEPEDEELAMNLGADAFILKPAEPDDFLARMRKVRSPARKSATPLPPSAPGHPDHFREYSETLIRKLEEKSLQLAETNRTLRRDIAARKEAEAQLRRTEEQLRQAQKMEAIGVLAGGIAHDFNNLLSVILSYADLSLYALDSDHPVRADIEEIRRAGERATALTRQLLAFSRQQTLRPRVLDLSQVTAAMNEMLGLLLGADIELSMIAPKHLGKVHADPTQIEQIIMNLAVNARDAMPTGGRLAIETSEVMLDEQHGVDHPDVTPGPFVVLSVSDTGMGMDAETRGKIFEPFFTTKALGKGTGLGLSTVFGIVRQSKGFITVQSEPGEGTTFKVYFPRTARAEESTSECPPAPTTLSGSETVLLVEDDDQVRSATRAILERHGYEVLEAKNGGEAFMICERHEGVIHLLLADVVMPRMSGPELATRLTSMRCDLRVIYFSGYAEAFIPHEGSLDIDVPILRKPITPDSLLRSVRETLDAL